MSDFKLPKRLADERERLSLNAYDTIGDSAIQSGFEDGFNAAAELIFREIVGPIKEELKKHTKHLITEDCWYSCPASGESCREYLDGPICNCGAEIVTEVIERMREWCE